MNQDHKKSLDDLREVLEISVSQHKKKEISIDVKELMELTFT